MDNNKHQRPSWDEYFIKIANTVAERATCDRGRSGCVVVRNKQMLVTGYVGSKRRDYQSLCQNGACRTERHLPSRKIGHLFRRCYPILPNDSLQNLCHDDYQLRHKKSGMRNEIPCRTRI